MAVYAGSRTVVVLDTGSQLSMLGTWVFSSCEEDTEPKPTTAHTKLYTHVRTYDVYR